MTLEERDAEEFVLVLQGYFSLLTERDLPATFIKSSLDETRKILLYAVIISTSTETDIIGNGYRIL